MLVKRPHLPAYNRRGLLPLLLRLRGCRVLGRRAVSRGLASRIVIVIVIVIIIVIVIVIVIITMITFQKLLVRGRAAGLGHRGRRGRLLLGLPPLLLLALLAPPPLLLRAQAVTLHCLNHIIVYNTR